MEGRDDKGRFVSSGNPKGRPKERKKYMDILRSTLTPTHWRAICKKAIEQAEAGDKAARRWVADYALGKPLQRIKAEVDTRSEVDAKYAHRLDIIYGTGGDGPQPELSSKPD